MTWDKYSQKDTLSHHIKDKFIITTWNFLCDHSKYQTNAKKRYMNVLFPFHCVKRFRFESEVVVSHNFLTERTQNLFSKTKKCLRKIFLQWEKVANYRLANQHTNYSWPWTKSKLLIVWARSGPAYNATLPSPRYAVTINNIEVWKGTLVFFLWFFFTDKYAAKRV